MAEFDNWRNDATETRESSTSDYLRRLRNDRTEAVDRAVADLVDFGVGQGFNDNQIQGALLDLFETYPTEWFLYIFVGSDNISTAITNDVSLTWLDLDANGQTIRQRLLNRL